MLSRRQSRPQCRWIVVASVRECLELVVVLCVLHDSVQYSKELYEGIFVLTPWGWLAFQRRCQMCIELRRFPLEGLDLGLCVTVR